MPTTSALGKTFCQQCGWNREAAEKHTRLFLRLLPVLVIAFDAPLIVWIFIGHAEMPILGLLAAVAIIPAILVVLAVRGKVRLGASGTPSAEAVTSQAGATSITAPSDAVAKQYKMVAELQRPRPVRMSRQGKMMVAIIAISLLAFAGALVAMAVLHPGAARVPATDGNAMPVRPAVYLLPIGLVAVIAFVMRRSLVQQRWLLAMGELAMGRVTKQWIARNGNGIRYEFTAPAGETLSRMTIDNARQLLAGMSVPIFYDPRQPKKQVALCASFYEVVLPGEE
jgi:hypothetical protein